MRFVWRLRRRSDQVRMSSEMLVTTPMPIDEAHLGTATSTRQSRDGGNG